MLMIARRGLYLFHLICAPRVGPGSLRLARRERKGKKGKERRLHPSSSPSRLIPAAKIFARTKITVTVLEERCTCIAREKLRPKMRLAAPFYHFFDFIHPPFFPARPQPTTAASELKRDSDEDLLTGTIRDFVWVSSSEGGGFLYLSSHLAIHSSFSLAPLPFSFLQCRMVSHFLLE